MSQPSDIAFSDSVKSVQERLGSREIYSRAVAKGQGWDDHITPAREAYIKECDSLYIATASADGQPYIQHRGGPKGFLKILDKETLGFADYRGNRQYISMGNLAENDKACLFLMDYPHRARLKIWGRAEVVENDPVLLARLTDEQYGAAPERAIVFHVEAWDRNCPQHIVQRFTEEEVDARMAPLRGRIAELETELRRLRG